VVLSGVSYVARGQSSCAQTLRLAQSIYEQGRLHELPQLLGECLRGTAFTDEERVNAYKLLALTYIYLEEPVKADSMMLALLRTDTEFTINDNVDPAEFVALHKTFRTWPIYRIGGKLGGIATGPTIVSADYVDDGANTYKYNFGFTGRISAEIPINGQAEKFTLSPELGFERVSFDGTNSGADPVKVTEGTETQGWISLPVSMQYKLYEKGISKIYVAGGLSADYLISSSVKIFSSRGEDNATVAENSFDVIQQRNRFNSGLLLSAGLKRKIGNGFLVIEARYKMGLLPMLTKADTYENSILVWDYKYVDGIFKLNSLSISAGYVLNRYNPKKLTTR